MREEIRLFSGPIIGYIERSGNEYIAKNYSGVILGRYDGKYTKDFSGKILFQGNCLSYLILKDAKY